MSALSNREHLSDRKQEVGWLEDILKTEFFAVIKKSCGESVEKYWLTGVLSVMGEPGIVTFHHLMDLLYSKKTTNVLTELSYRELMQKWSEDKTYYLLFYLGILTFDKDSGYLSVPNRCMHQLVSPKVSCF